MQEIIDQVASELGVDRRTVTDEEIVARLIGALIDEGKKIVAEGIAQRSGDIDVVYVYGYGFPAARGGPMFYGANRG